MLVYRVSCKPQLCHKSDLFMIRAERLSHFKPQQCSIREFSFAFCNRFDQARYGNLAPDHRTKLSNVNYRKCLNTTMRIWMLILNVTRALWINHKRPSSRVVHDNSVINWKGIHREPSNVPRADLDWAAESGVQREGRRTRDLLYIALFNPTGYTVLCTTKNDNITIKIGMQLLVLTQRGGNTFLKQLSIECISLLLKERK